MERRQRAEAFARLLESTRAPAMRDARADDASCRAELEWGASALIAHLLALSMPASARPAPAMFNLVPCLLVGALTSLKDRLLISEVFGRIALTTGARLIASGKERTPLSAIELDVLRVLAEVPEPERWVSHADAARAHTLHVGTYPRTPDMTELVALGVLHPRCLQGFVLGLAGEVGRWRETVLRAAAILWETGPGAEWSDMQWLRDWTDRVAMIDWSDAPAAMSHAGRIRFLDAATEVILRERDLRCSWQREELRLRMEQNEPFQVEPVEMLAVEPSTPLGRYRQYEQRFRRRISHHGGREEITELIGAVIRHDDATGASPCARIHALIRGSDERPFLAYWVPFALHARPAAIAWCLTHDDLAAFAAGLLLELEIAEESTWIGGQERIERQVEQRIALWDAAMRVVFSEVTLERIDALAAALAEILQAAAAAAITRRLLDEEAAAAERRGMDSILDRTLDAIQSARFSHEERPGPGLESFRPRVLPYLARPLFVQLASAPEPEKHDFASFPLATMRLLMRWREMIQEARQIAPANRRIPTDQEIASAVIARYRNELDRELLANDASVKPVIYIDDQPDLASLPWGVIARALYGSPELETLLRPVPFQDRIRQIPATAARVTTATRYDAVDAALTQVWSNKLRLHLRILLVAHGQLHQLAAPVELVDTIEVAILDLLLVHCQDDFAAGTLKVFQRLNVFRADMAALTLTTAEALNRFTPDRRATAYASWIDTLNDLGLLVTALPAILPAGTRSHAEQRLASVAKRDFLRDEYSLPHIQQLAEQAVSARELDLAERILQFGHDATRSHSLESEWDEFEYRTRAAIAFARGDRAAFDALPAPDSRSNLERGHRIASTTRFYEALFALGTDPAAAAEIFAHQDPQHSASVARNLFAARLRAAAKVEDEHDSRAAFERALEEWQRNAARLPALPRSAHASAQVNVLIALDGARHDDAFDATWASLPVDARLQLTAIQVRVANAQRRGKLVVAKLAVDEAVAYHQAGSGTAPSKLLSCRRSSRVQSRLLHPWRCRAPCVRGQASKIFERRFST